MKLPTIECARAVRDGGINAIAALDYALRPALVGLCDEDAQELKLAFGHAMSDLIDKFINPAVRAFPELHPDDATWAAVVTERAPERGQAMIAKKKRLVFINKSPTALGRRTNRSRGRSASVRPIADIGVPLTSFAFVGTHANQKSFDLPTPIAIRCLPGQHDNFGNRHRVRALYRATHANISC